MMEGTEKLIVIVPMKPLAEGKARLAPALEADQRAALSLLMLAHVLLSARDAVSVTETWVIGGDYAVQRLAKAISNRWLPDPGGGLNKTLAQAFGAAFETGTTATLYLPGDLPLLTPASIDRLAAQSQTLEKAVVTPAERDGGTNGLLLPQGPTFRPLLGPSSFHRHLDALRADRYQVVIHKSHQIGFDVDTPEDWEQLLKTRPEMVDILQQWQATLFALNALPETGDGSSSSGLNLPPTEPKSES